MRIFYSYWDLAIAIKGLQNLNIILTYDLSTGRDLYVTRDLGFSSDGLP